MPAWTVAGRERPTERIPCTNRVFLRGRVGNPCFRVTGLPFIAASAIATSSFGSIHGLFQSTAFDVARNLVLFLAVAFWLGLAYWVWRDARRRIDDSWLIGTATLLALAFPYVGALIYMLFRPPETLDDVRARKIEVRALEEGLHRHVLHCPVCRADVEAGFLVCPICTTQLKQPCAQCAAPLQPSWLVCPYCATSTVTAVREIVSPDLDAALAAEAALTADAGRNGNGNARARPPRPRKTRSG